MVSMSNPPSAGGAYLRCSRTTASALYFLNIGPYRALSLSLIHILAYVEGKLFEDYIHDMRIVQRFAVLNRKAMMDVILSGMGFTKADEFTTIHNYIRCV